MFYVLFFPLPVTSPYNFQILLNNFFLFFMPLPWYSLSSIQRQCQSRFESQKKNQNVCSERGSNIWTNKPCEKTSTRKKRKIKGERKQKKEKRTATTLMFQLFYFSSFIVFGLFLSLLHISFFFLLASFFLWCIFVNRFFVRKFRLLFVGKCAWIHSTTIVHNSPIFLHCFSFALFKMNFFFTIDKR